MKIDNFDSEEKLNFHMEKVMFHLWLKESGESNEYMVEHLRNCIRIAIKECLTPTQRRYIELYMGGFNQTEISQKCGVNKSVVSKALKRAFKNLFDHVKYASPRTLKANEKVKKYVTGLYK